MAGTFSADDKHYPAGWYLRNPPASGHRPYSDEGAMIFVKLWQMPADETRYVAIDTNKASLRLRRHRVWPKWVIGKSLS